MVYVAHATYAAGLVQAVVVSLVAATITVGICLWSGTRLAVTRTQLVLVLTATAALPSTPKIYPFWLSASDYLLSAELMTCLVAILAALVAFRRRETDRLAAALAPLGSSSSAAS